MHVHVCTMYINISISSVPRHNRRRETWWMILVSSGLGRLIPVRRPNQLDLTQWTWTKMVCEYGISHYTYLYVYMLLSNKYTVSLYLEPARVCVYLYDISIYFRGQGGVILPPLGILLPPLKIGLPYIIVNVNLHLLLSSLPVVLREGDAGRGSCQAGQHTGEEGQEEGQREADGGG